MNCEAVQQENIAERYVLGQLTEPGLSAFEGHFFTCAACLAEVQTLQSIRNAGNAPAAGQLYARVDRRATWAGIAAVLLVGCGLIAATQVWKKAPEAAQPANRAAVRDNGATSRAVLLLARVEAPRYTASTLRGASDQAAGQFRAAMKDYMAGDYAAAAEGLRAAVAAQGDAAGPRFYLGVCDLLTGRTDEAVADLRGVIGLGESPYLEQARFFLAKALLTKQDLAGASKELELTIQLGGDRAAESRLLLDQVRALPAAR